ncbi:hypothetical protein M409DRAFT_23526 [Zasmidium cellare ATCC 36951]|uniref:Retrovirus-related Pol polyprotein from transposon TNT 1-94-like beta-barrel domain-containing protein n=1 Tax=Zasmidium cellare ATCC 36951 TaxID=1080233 RepID=A0A6A6CGM0_ZASCE|nr:uncharacterized protein M409DRAFT_23526 [Zasmidium cellare ATCC 36951]KAF2166334.1 hypothetical protein M409DRAFT_23526 [Zasmidium cellare ATCC 36951]
MTTDSRPVILASGDTYDPAFYSAVSKNNTIVDNGTSSYLTHDLSHLKHYQVGNIGIRFRGNNSRAEAMRIMVIDIVNEKGYEFELQKTLYVPDVPASLISAEKFL